MTLTNFFECFANSKQKFILSCSGGVDSQVMLFLALKYLPHDLLTVVYFNHNKRNDIDYDVAAIKSLSEVNLVAPYRLIGLLALSVESATTFLTF